MDQQSWNVWGIECPRTGGQNCLQLLEGLLDMSCKLQSFWHLVYVDDLHGAFTGTSKFELLWVWLLAFEVIGTPFGYHKFKGGFSSDFVGFHLRYDRNEVGITVKERDLVGRLDTCVGGEEVC